MIKKEDYLKIIVDLIELCRNFQQAALEETYARALTLLENLYGNKNIRISDLSKYKIDHFNKSPWNESSRRDFGNYLLGVLKGMKNDIENNFIEDVQRQAIGSVVADFLVLAKQASEGNYKDVAAVLACAALEDTLKRYALLNELEVESKEMSEVINALKGKALLKGPQASLISSYIQTRNKAFHAEWTKIEMPEVKSLIVFTEEFILKNFS